MVRILDKQPQGDAFTSVPGIGPEISESVKAIYSAADVSVYYVRASDVLNAKLGPYRMGRS
jgi:hypothetical protein